MNEIIQSSVYTTQKGTPVTDSVKVARAFDKFLFKQQKGQAL